jgi:hypothetical protein
MGYGKGPSHRVNAPDVVSELLDRRGEETKRKAANVLHFPF